MDDQTINNLMKEYNNFNNKLFNDIYGSNISTKSEDCCLMKKNVYLNIINKKSNIFSLKLDEIFISDFSKLVDCLKNKINFIIINKSSIDLIYKNKNNSIVLPYIQYYGGNNKIIITSKTRNDRPILILNPLDENPLNINAFGLSIRNENLYKGILNEKNDSNIINKFKQYIFNLDNYVQNNNNTIKKVNNKNNIPTQNNNNSITINNNMNQINNTELFNEKIFEILLYFFYYKKHFNEKGINIFNDNNNDYYLINPKWFDDFLAHYEYQNLSKQLINDSKNNPKININNLNSYLTSYKKIYLSKNRFKCDKGPFNDILDINNIFMKVKSFNNKLSFNNCYIIHSIIIDKINKYQLNNNKQVSNNIKKIFSKNSYIVFNDNKNIIIGKILQNLLFIPKFIISYNSNEIFEAEIKILLNDFENLEDYLRHRKFNNNSNSQYLFSEENKQIAFLTIINQKTSTIPVKKSIKIENVSPKNTSKNKQLEKSKNSGNENNFATDNSCNKQTRKELTRAITEGTPFINNSHINNNRNIKNIFNNNIKNKNAISLEKINLTKKIKNNKVMNERYNTFKNNSNKKEESDIFKNTAKDLQATLTNNSKDNEKQNKELKEKDMLIKNLQKEYNDLQNELNSQKTEYKKELENYKKQLKDFQNELKEKDINLNKLMEIKEQIENELKEKDINLNKQIEINKQIENELKSIKEKNNMFDMEKYNTEEKNKEILMLNQKYKELEKNNQIIIREKDSKIKDLESDYYKVQNELEKIRNLLNATEIELNNMNKKYEEIQKKNNNEMQKINDLFNDRDNSLKMKEKENIELKNKMAKILKELNIREQKITIIEKEKVNISNENNELKKKFDTIKKRYEEQMAINNDLMKMKQNTNQNQINFNNNNNQNINNNISNINNNLQSSQYGTQIINNIINDNRNNNNQNPTNIKQLPPVSVVNKPLDPLDLYDRPPKIGLTNIGATCFMNSTLQCLSQTRVLTNYFLNEKNKDKIINNNIANNNKNEPQLSPAYSELISKLWDKNSSRDYSPYHFMAIIEKMNPLFKKGQAGDSKDFIIYILEQFHKELKKSIKPLLTPNNSNNTNNTNLNQYDKSNAFNHFFDDFQKECSIISDLFFGFNETTNECLYCKQYFNSQGKNNPICYNYGIFNCLIFPLQEVYNMKINFMQNNNFMNMYQNNRVSIYECFFYNQKTEHFTGDNRNYCNICKQTYDSNYTSRIFSSPNILVLILNRGKDNVYNVKIDFSEQIDITQFVLARDNPQMIYNLYGVITHIGQSGPNAHFVASCKSPIDNKWYRYNDAIVNPINNIQNDVIDFGTPYILFYEKQDNQAQKKN